MRIAFLSSLTSIHTTRWVNVFAEHGHEVHAISIDKPNEPLHKDVKVHILPFPAPLGYYLNALCLKKLLKQIQPDILNAHYASGYGTLARLSDFHPCLLSVWGSDVYDFPYESKIKMRIIRKNLENADVIGSTSEVMKVQTETLLLKPKKIYITPFGIDTKLFTRKENFSEAVKTIGTVKTLSPKYGISTLIKAFAILLNILPHDKELKLVIAGGGEQRTELEQLTQTLGIVDRVDFVGKIPHGKVPEMLKTFDIYCALSESESFGVAILEASACGLPVVVSDAGGLPEVVDDGVTGIVVPKDNPQAAADALYKLYCSTELRKQFGENGVKRVEGLYSWKKSYKIMLDVFEKTVAEGGTK